ncbi:hypothetical protein [Hymenobacter convexus]|uniref:hypothetical protein n=1 Tax=Hymenobacter sp. CA1UV-4 TaxID=3063782 RepID=UPI0027130249|nr:hypothetical protein [Hymenobacter sp. CA1UV-4]MDO7850023.1 hypothetical protein [Hymenobacter sp. CA1UV-4]
MTHFLLSKRRPALFSFQWLGRLALGAAAMLGSQAAHAQISGSKTIPGDYPSVTAAIADLNTQGVGAGGVTFNVAAGYAETFASPTAGSITVTGTAANPIVFRKAGTGTNPLITAALNGTGTGADYVIRLTGTDYITFNGIDVQENAANIASNAVKTEYGYYLTRASATDGCQNVLITNCGISLDRSNSATVGIFSANINFTASSAAGANSANKFTSNTISNCAVAIYLQGNGTFTTAAVLDAGNEIGSGGGNTLTNIGANSGAVYGIRAEGQSGLKIENNTLTLSTTTTTNNVRGIAVGTGGATAFAGTVLINNNTVGITNAAGSSGTVVGIQQGASSNISGVSITNNRVQDCVLPGSGEVHFIEDQASGTSIAINITGNTIFNNSVANNTLNYGIYRSAATSASVTIGAVGAGNAFRDNTFSATSPTIYGVHVVTQSPTTSPVALVANTISNNTHTSTGAPKFYGLYVGTGVITATGNTIAGNSISNGTGSTPSVLYGYFSGGSATAETVTGNTVTGNTLAGSNTITGLILQGLTSSSTNGAKTFSQNTIGGNTLGAAGSTNSGEVRGISIAAGTAANAIGGNKIYGNVAYGPNSRSVGIAVASGATHTLANNLIGGLSAPASADLNAVVGISTTAAANLYHNTIYLAGSSTATNSGSSGVYVGTTSNAVDLRNNLVVNTSTPGGTGVAAALRRLSGTTGTAPTNLASTSNNNLYYAGTPSGTRLIYAEGTGTLTNALPSLAAYQALVAARESNSLTGSVSFASVNGADGTFLHFAPGTPQPVESAGQVVASVGADFEGDARGPYPNGAGGTAPDIGADEGDFLPVDRTPPAIVIATPLGNQPVGSGPTLAGVAITDASGVNVAAGTAPRLYFKLSTDGNAFNDNTSGTAGWKFVESSTGASPFSFTIDYSLLPTTPVAGTIIQYFVVAQDLAAIPNVGINAPNTFAATPASVALSGAAFPIGGTPLSYTLLEGFGGTVSVGPGEVYGGQPLVSLTAAGGLFARLNAGILTSNLTVLITGDIMIEDGANALNPLTEQGAGGYSVSIQPSAATERLITGAAGSMGPAGIVLNGADRVTIDGRVGQAGTAKYLRLRNTSAGGPVFTVQQDATGNTLRDCYVEGGTTSTSNGVVFIGNSNTTAVGGVAAGVSGNDNTSILNCDIFKAAAAANRPAQAIYSATPSVAAASPSGVTITGNNLYDWATNGIVTTGAGSNWTINGNSFYQTTTATATAQTALNLGAVSSSATTGWVVSGNYIGGSAAQAGGAAWTNSAVVAFRGIYLNGLGTANAPSTTVSGNFVRNISLTAAGASTFSGIEVKSDNTSYLLSGNTVSDISSATTQGGSLGGTGLIGIYTLGTASASQAQQIVGNFIFNLSATATATLNNYVTGILTKSTSNLGTGTAAQNRVYNLTNASAGAGAGLVGIQIGGGAWSVRNNQVVLSNGSNTNPQAVYALLDNVFGSGITTTWYFNSAVVSGSNTGTTKSYAYNRSGTVGANVRNNLLLNLRTGGTANFAIGINNTTSFTSNNNDLYAADPAKLGEVNTTAYTFATWKTNTSQDAASLNIPAKFVDPAAGNLNLDATTNCSLNNAGVAITGVNGEFDDANTSRQTTPDLGSDEFTPVPQTATIATPGPVCGPTTASVTLTGNGGPFAVTYTDGTTPVTTTAAASPFTFAAAAGKTYTLTSVSDAYGCSLTPGGSLTVNPLPTAALASPGTTLCPGSSATVNTTLTGTPPYTVTVARTDASGTTSQTATVPLSAYSLSYPLTQSTTFAITAVTDANGCAADVNGLPSIAFTVTDQTTYKGVNSDWFDAANWTACVPSATVDAVIPAGLNFYPNLSTTATADVRTLTLASGARLAQSAGTLNVYGDLTSSTSAANVSLTGGTVAFRGATPTLTGPLALYNLAVNLASTSGVLALANDVTVANTLTMSQGVLNTGTYAVTLTLTATIAAETDASYVLGQVAVPGRNVSSATTESFGNIGLTLTPDAASTVFPGLTTVVRTTGTVLTGVGASQSIKRYFDIQPATNTGLNVAMSFSYFDHERNGIAVGNVALSKSVSGTSGPWASQAPITIAGNTVGKTGITDFSVWTLGSAANPLPVVLTAFTATRQGLDAHLTWATASEKNSAGFEVQVSGNGRDFRLLGFVASASPGSTTARQYAFLDAEKGKAGPRYYRLRQVDLSGAAEFSPVRTVRFDAEAAPALQLRAAPNPFRNQLALVLTLPTGMAAAPAQLRLTDAAGRLVLALPTAALAAGENQLAPLDLHELASGVYFVQLAFPGQPAQHLKVVKE